MTSPPGAAEVMAVNAYEQRQLRQIEECLAVSDPGLTAALQTFTVRPRSNRKLLVMAGWLLAVVAALLGWWLVALAAFGPLFLCTLIVFGARGGRVPGADREGHVPYTWMMMRYWS